MRVLIVTGIFPPDIGGPATYVPRTARELVDRGHDVHVLTLADREPPDDYPFPILAIRRATFRPLRWIRTIVRIALLARRSDVVYVNGLQLESAIASLFFKRRYVMKVVGDWAWERSVARGWTTQDFEDFQNGQVSVPAKIQRTLRTWEMKRAATIIAPSEYLAAWARGAGIAAERVEVINNAFGEAAEAVRRDALLSRPQAAVVGRLMPWKRIDQVIGAIDAVEGMSLVVVGDGPERSRLEQLVSHRSLQDRVIFTGAVGGPEARSIIASSDLLLLNSTYEGLPHVVLEAMSLGIPVVATDAGGTGEVLRGGGGVLVDLEMSSLAEALRRLRDDGDLRKVLGEQGQRVVRERFSIERMLSETVSLLAKHARHDGRAVVGSDVSEVER